MVTINISESYVACQTSTIGYYSDTWRIVHNVKLEGRCASKYIRADAIEGDVWDEILELFSDRVALRDKLELAQQQESEALDPIREKLQIIDDMIRRTEAEVARVGRALQTADPEGDVYKSVKIDEAQVNAPMAELRAKREKFIKQLGARTLTDDRIGTIMQFADDLAGGIDNADFNKKRYTLETLGAVVTVTPGKYHLSTIFGSTDGTISQIGHDGMRIARNLFG